MFRKKMIFWLVVSMVLSLLCVNAAHAKRFLTLPFEGEFDQSATFCSYRFDDGSCHGGNDYPTPNGTPIVAAADGLATAFPDPKKSPSLGNHIEIDHGDGWLTMYAHLSSFATGIVAGAEPVPVYRGQIIGYSGTSGGPWWQTDGTKRDAYHLHFEVRKDGIPVDPYSSNDYLWLTNPPSRSAVVQFSCYSTVYVFSGDSNGQLFPILNDKVYSLLGYRQVGCTMTPDWSYVIKLPPEEKSNYTIRDEVIPSENNSATGNMIAYRVVPKVGPTSCMSIAVDTTRIYLFEDGKFCHIANEEVYKDLGYKADFSDVVNITPELFAYYGEGEEVQTFSFSPISIFLSDSSSSQTPTPTPTPAPTPPPSSGSPAPPSSGSPTPPSSPAPAPSAPTDMVLVPDQYRTIQEAINAAGNGYTVLVDNGTYFENIKLSGKSITIRSKNGAENTIIDGRAKGSVVIVNETGGNLQESITIDGFTITNGYATEINGYYGAEDGGGIHCLAASLTIKNCIITKNKGTKGGGVYCKKSSLIMRDSEITDNVSSFVGGGIEVENTEFPIKIYDSTIKGNFAKCCSGGIEFYECFSSDSVIENCRIEENRSEYAGGVYIVRSPAKIVNTYFVKNISEEAGGGIYIASSSPAISNCCILENRAKKGGGIYFTYSSSKIMNCTVSGNHADNGGGIYDGYEPSSEFPEFVNSILWNNGSNQISISGKGSVTVKYCNIQGGYSGEGNIDKDPLFIDPSKGDYHLQSKSPCVNAGTNSGAPTTDFDGDKRPQGSGYDIGADEHICADADGDGYYAIAGCGTELDCDDTNTAVHPNGVKINYYPDADGDGYGNIDLPIQSCCPPVGYVIDNTDCKDTDPKINPGAKSICDGINNNCNWKVDDGFDVGASCAVGIGGCQRTGKKVCSGDGKTTVCNAVAGKPAAEVCCNGIDDDCDGQVDEVKDKVAPKAVVKKVITVQLGANGKVAITAADVDNGSSDNCGIAKMTVSISSFTQVGSYKVTLTVTDKSGNKSTCKATVTVEDKIPPKAVAKNFTAQLDASGKITITAANVDNGSSDNAGIASMTVSPSAFTCANIGNPITVTLTVIDKGGNKSSCTAIVTVEDKRAPKTIAKSVIIQLNSSGKAAITVADVNNGSSDNCGIDSMAVSLSNFTNIGSYKVVLTVTDTNGNKGTCKVTVKVEDKIAPVAKCKDITIQLNPKGKAAITAANVNDGSSDNCKIASMNVSPSSFTIANIGLNTVTLTVTDKSGNKSACACTVTVKAYKK